MSSLEYYVWYLEARTPIINDSVVHTSRVLPSLHSTCNSKLYTWGEVRAPPCTPEIMVQPNALDFSARLTAVVFMHCCHDDWDAWGPFQYWSPCAEKLPNSPHRGPVTQRTHDPIITSLWRQNDVVTSFWRHNDVIIVSCVCWKGGKLMFLCSDLKTYIIWKSNERLEWVTLDRNSMC